MEKQQQLHTHTHTHTHTHRPEVSVSGPKPSPSFPPLQVCLFLLPTGENLASGFGQIPRKPETKPLVLLLSPPHLTNSR